MFLLKKSKNQKIKKSRNQNRGFSLPELLVSLAIITLLMLVVLPNFRAGQRSQEFDVNLKQVVEGITSVRTKSLAGQLLVNETWPTGTTTDGYGIRFRLAEPGQYELFALLPEYVVPEERKPELATSPQKIGSIEIISLWGLSAPAEGEPFPKLGQAPWQNIALLPAVSLEIIFSLPEAVAAVVIEEGETEVSNEFKYVGGIIEHTKSGKRGYFYVSLFSGAVNYGLY